MNGLMLVFFYRYGGGERGGYRKLRPGEHYEDVQKRELDLEIKEREERMRQRRHREERRRREREREEYYANENHYRQIAHYRGHASYEDERRRGGRFRGGRERVPYDEYSRR